MLQDTRDIMDRLARIEVTAEEREKGRLERAAEQRGQHQELLHRMSSLEAAVVSAAVAAAAAASAALAMASKNINGQDPKGAASSALVGGGVGAGVVAVVVLLGKLLKFW